MADRWAVALAAAAALGALHPSGVPVGAALAVAVVGLGARRPVVLCVGVELFGSALAARSLAGLDGVAEGPVDATVVLVGDPRPSGAGLRADARLGPQRVELRAAGHTAEDLAGRLAGEVVQVRGRLAPVDPGDPWLRSRHIAGRLTVHRVGPWEPGPLPARLANGLRRTLAAGADPLPAAQRALFTGLVVGDDRHQPPDLADDFLGAGMTHLLAVSGQNVAFCLLLAGPVLRRLRLWPRLVATLTVIGLFGLMTRFEPSVLRASAMAALAATVLTMGQPLSRVRVLALATTGLLLVDPLLVHAVGFRLSLAAALAIVVLAERVAAVLPGPAPLREALAVTATAQLGVAPVLIATFGPMPVAAIPANLLAVPVAGLVMAWGLTAGMVAGLAGGAVAGLVHLPTGLALGWLELVADRAAAAPLGELGAGHTAAVAAAVLGALVARRALARAAVAVLVVAVLGAAALQAAAPPPVRTALATGLVRWHAGGTDVVVLGGAGGRTPLGARTALEALRRARVGAIDLLVVADGTVAPATVAAVRAAHPVGAVVAHHAALDALDGSGAPAAERAPPVDTVTPIGDLQVRFAPADDRVVVEAWR